MTPEQKREKAVGLLQTGASAKQISRQLHLSLQTVYELIDETGLRPIRRGMSDDQRRAIARYYEGHTVKATAEKFGVSVPTVMRCAKKFGLTREGKLIVERGWFFGPRDRRALGLNEEKVQEALAVLGRFHLAPTVDEDAQCMYLVFAHPEHTMKRMVITVPQAIDLLLNPLEWLKTNAELVKTSLKED